MSSEKEKSSQTLILAIIVAAFSLMGGIWLSQKHFLENNDTKIVPGVEITVLPVARELKPFILQTDEGKPFTPATLKGQWSFLFFGYTNCPDICPTTLRIMQSVWKKLPTKQGQPGHPRLYFISVDPDRDSAATLKSYTRYFNPEFTGVTGHLDEIDKLVNQLGIMYGYDEKDNGNDKDYNVNHSASLILIDPRGRMRAVISPPHIADKILADFERIRIFYGDK